MLYPDLDRRVQELRKIAEVFEKHSLFETASRVVAIEALLQEGVSQKAKFTEFIELLKLCEFEFGNQDVGGEYRRICFNQIGHAFLDVSVNSGFDVRATINEFEILLLQITRGRKIVGEISDFARRNEVDEVMLFHLTCYSYVIVVEATFDELARILFFVYSLKDGKKLTLEQLQGIEVSYIDKKLVPKPIFLHNWREKKHIRNAISHATAYYDEPKKSIRFVDNMIEPFDKTMSFGEFGEQLLELESTIDAFIFFFLLLKVNDLLFCLDLFQ